MAEPVSAAKIALTAAKLLLTRNQDGESFVTHIVIGIATGICILLVLVYVAVNILLMPMDALTEYFLSDSIQEARQSMDWIVNRPVIQTSEEGFCRCR